RRGAWRGPSYTLPAVMRRLLLVAAVSVVAVLGLAAPAQAHPTLLVTSPAADGAEAVAPGSVALVFNEPVTIGAQALGVTDAAGRSVGVDQVTTTHGGTTLTGRFTGVLPPGVYTVRWRATGTDGDLVESSFRFAVVEAAAFAAALGLSVTRLRGWVWLPVAAVAVAEGWRSHTNTAVPVWGGLLTGVHLAAAAVWAGALAHVVVTAVVWRSQPKAVWWAVSGYARWAGWLFATVVATGTVSALVLVPLPALATTAYGRLL